MGDLIQIRDYQSRRDRERALAELEKQAIEIANVAFPSVFGFADLTGQMIHGGVYLPSEKDPA